MPWRRGLPEIRSLGDLPVVYAPAHTRNPVTFRARLAHLAPELGVLDTNVNRQVRLSFLG